MQVIACEEAAGLRLWERREHLRGCPKKWMREDTQADFGTCSFSEGRLVVPLSHERGALLYMP